MLDLNCQSGLFHHSVLPDLKNNAIFEITFDNVIRKVKKSKLKFKIFQVIYLCRKIFFTSS